METIVGFFFGIVFVGLAFILGRAAFGFARTYFSEVRRAKSRIISFELIDSESGYGDVCACVLAFHDEHGRLIKFNRNLSVGATIGQEYEVWYPPGCPNKAVIGPHGEFFGLVISSVFLAGTAIVFMFNLDAP